MTAARITLVPLSLLLALAIAGPAPAAAPDPVAPATRPNIILILTDDLDTASMPFLPRLDALLADQGTTFTNFFVSDSLCCPSRSTILRGQYNHNHHVLTNIPPDGGFQRFHDLGEEGSTIATWLHDGGYRTILLGKYLNGFPGSTGRLYVPPGWDEFYVPVDGTPYSQYDYTLEDSGRHSEIHGHRAKDYLDDVLTARAAKFIRTASAGAQPFFMYLAPYTPHKPFTPAPRYLGAFPGATAPRPPSFNEEDMSDKPAWYQQLPPLTSAESAQLDEIWRKRLQSMLAVEDMVQTIVDTLDQTGELDNTYIFFTSDNGFHLGTHRLFLGKQSPYEEDVRVPLIVRGPGVPAGASLPHLTGNVDLAATFSELAGVTPPRFVDGISMAPLLGASPPAPGLFRRAYLLEHVDEHPGEETAAASRKTVAPQGTLEPLEPVSGGARNQKNVPAFKGLRLQDMLYVRYHDGEEEIYDLANDPYELANAVSTTDPALLADLRSLLDRMRQCAGADCR